MTSQPLTLHITWHFPPDQVSTFYDALRPLHEKLVLEKECLYMNVYEIAQQPGVVRLVEIWDCDMKWMVEVSSFVCEVGREDGTGVGLTRCRFSLRKTIMHRFLRLRRALRCSRRRLRL